MQAVLRGLAGSREGRDRERGACGITPHAQAVRRRRTGHGPDGSATLGLKPARAVGATTVFEGEQSAAVCRVESVETAPGLVKVPVGMSKQLSAVNQPMGAMAAQP